MCPRGEDGENGQPGPGVRGCEPQGHGSQKLVEPPIQDWRHATRAAQTPRDLLEELVEVTAQRLQCEASRDTANARLAAIIADREALQRDTAQAAAIAKSIVLGLPRSQLEELRSLSNPPRIVHETIGLLYAMLQPAEMLESVEHARWETVSSVLQRNELLHRIAEFPPANTMAGVLLAVPAVRQVLEGLQSGKSQSDVKQENRWGRAPYSARTSKSFAAGIAAQLLVLKPQSPSGYAGKRVAPQQRLILRSQDDSDLGPPIADTVGLISYINDGPSVNVDVLATVSPAVSAILQWALSQLRNLKAHVAARACSDDAEVEAKCERDEAEKSLVRLGLQEGRLVEDVVRARRTATDVSQSRSFVVESDTDKIVAGTVTKFSKGSALMSSLATKPLHGLAGVLTREPDIRLAVVGSGDVEESDDLPLRRAQAVVKFFNMKGFAADRFYVMSTKGPPCVKFVNAEPFLIQEPISFPACGDALSPEAEASLAPVAALLRDAPFLQISVEGHADNGPMWLGNLALSDSRAGRVVSYLQRSGVADEQMTLVAHGERQPRASNEHPEGRAANRRVELKLIPGASAANVQNKYQQLSLPAERSRSMLLALALVTADMCGGRGSQKLLRMGSKHFTLGSMLRQAAADTLSARGALWSSQLLL